MNLVFPAIAIAGLAICLFVAAKTRSLPATLGSIVLVMLLLVAFLPGDPPVVVDPESSPAPHPPVASQRPSDGGPRFSSPQELVSLRPVEITTHQYVGSDACRECHQGNHATWYDSYHRKMTQVASDESVLGDFDNRTIRYQDQDYVMYRDGDTFMANIPDVDDPALRMSVPIVMTTGSHHMQVYWFASGQGRMVGMLPLVWLNESQEWIPRNSAFLVPPDNPLSYEVGRWNETCSSCHSTHRKGRRLASGEWDTHVGEFGISCEACHGPGESHLALHRSATNVTDGNPVSRPLKDEIVNPEKLTKERSAQVCGQCHSVMDPLQMDLDFQENGHKFRPGMDLAQTHGLWTRESKEFEETVAFLNYPDLNTFLNETYYLDGMVRVSGREFSGMKESGCYLNGDMSCLSCHQLHQSDADERSTQQWANDQLRHDTRGDQACLQCHQADQYGESHTHHFAGSSGALCYNCHMPHTAYGLLKSIRNHKISSPDVGKDLAANRPNACNLCHLDKTFAWSAKYLDDWYSIDPPLLDEDQQTVAASLLWILRGNAADRALAAWHMGWKDAQQASGNQWQLPFLSSLVDDDYDAIRLIARRSIQSLPGGSDFHLDVVTSSTAQQRQAAGMELLTNWLKTTVAEIEQRPELLIERGGVRIDRIEDLIDQRDHTPMILSE